MSTPLILRNFQFTRDFRHIKWGATLWYNLLRAALAGVVLGILIALFPHTEDALTTALAAPFVWPIAYLIIFLPTGVVFAVLRSLPFVGLLAAFFALVAVAIGDPLVCILHKIQPKLVPVESPALFSLALIFWVLDAHELPLAE